MYLKTLRIFWLVILVLGLGLAGPPLAAQGDATPIAYGETVQGAVTTETPLVRFSFNGEQGDQINAAVSASAFDVYVTLSTEDGTLLASDDNSGPDTDALLTAALPGSGTYVLSVSRSPTAEADSVGPFTLTLTEGEPPVSDPDSTNTPDVDGDGGTVGGTIDATQPAPPSSGTGNTTGPSSSGQTTIITDARLQNIQVGAEVVGSFTAEQNFFVYWFEGQTGQQITIQADFTADITPLLTLYDPTLTEIVRAQPGNPLNATLERGGVHFLGVASLEADVPGQFGFEISGDLPLDTSNLPEDMLAYGQTRSSAITNTNPTRRFRFLGEAGDNVSLTMRRLDGDLDSYLILADSSGTTLAETDDSNDTEQDTGLSASLPANGEYFIIATRAGQERGFTTGRFELELASDAPPRLPDDSGRPALPADYKDLPQIQYGETVRGEISNEGFLNLWVFYGQGGDEIVIDMQADESGLDPLLVLLDANRIPLAEHDDIVEGVQRDAQLEFTLPDDGYYAIVATRFDQAEGTSTGAYTLSLRRQGAAIARPGDDLALADVLDATPLVAGETPSGQFQPLRMAQVYTFPAAQGQLIDFSVTADGGAQTTLILTDSNLQTVSDSDNGVLLAIRAPADDDYFVFVMPQRGPAVNSEAGYLVALNIEVDEGGAVASGEPIAIAYGSQVQGVISTGLTAQPYTFQGRNGDVVEINMAADSQPPLDTLLRLLGPDGEVIAENDDIDPGVVRDSRIRATLPADGQYTIIATRYEGADVAPTTGTYTLSLSAQDPAAVGVNAEAETITYGQTVTDAINDETFLHFYYFVGTQGDEVAVSITRTEGNLDAIAYLYTYTSSGDPFLLVANDDSSRGGTYDPYIEFTLPRSGPYLVGVTRYQGDDSEPTSGTYELTVELVRRPGEDAE